MVSMVSINSTNLTLDDQVIVAPLDRVEGKVQLAVYVLTFLVGLLGNALVLIVVYGKHSRRTVNDLYIMNLAVADLIFIAFLPLYSFNLFQRVIMYTPVCKFVLPVMTMTYFVSIYTLTCMAIHRCIVILNPFKPEMSHRKVYLCILVIWFISLVFVLPMSVVSIADATGQCIESWPSQKHKQAYTASLCMLQYIFPLSVITVAYIRICFDLNHERAPKHERHAQHHQFHRENLQIIKTLATIVILFAVCLLPGQVLWMLLDFGSKDEKSLQMLFSMSIILSAVHSCLNPIVYGTLTKQFRREYMRYLSYICGCCECSEGWRRPRLASVWMSISSEHHENNNKGKHVEWETKANGTTILDRESVV